MTKNQAQKQARYDSTMYRQGQGWIVSVWSDVYKCHVTSSELPWVLARNQLRTWREERISQLLNGAPEDWAKNPSELGLGVI